MKILLVILSSIAVFFKVQFESLFRLIENAPEEPERDTYTPKCGDYFNIDGLKPSDVTHICDMLFSLGVSGYGLGYPSDKHIAGAKNLWLIEHESKGLLIYFFNNDPRFIHPVNPPQSVDDLKKASLLSCHDDVPADIYSSFCASAYSNGEQAFRLGMSINDNPYIDKFIDHDGSDQWLCGYLAARENQLDTDPMSNTK